jgi:hypothetical protein
MEEDNPVMKLTFQNPFRSRRKGRPKLQWVDDIEANLKTRCERMKEKGIGQGQMEGCTGGGQGPKRAVAPQKKKMMHYRDRII